MKRIDLVRRLEKIGCVIIRHGGKHDWYHNPFTKVSQPIPRHREIRENLARHILKMLGDFGFPLKAGHFGLFLVPGKSQSGLK